MASRSVARAKKLPTVVFRDGNGALESTLTLEQVRLRCAELLAAGFNSEQVGIAMAKHLSPTANPRSAKHKLRRWMHNDKQFRDLIYEAAVTRLDLASPDILNGLKRSAVRGRVDAARFALEITGRHTSTEQSVTQVSVVLNNIPRPEHE
jgi:hypothetical protein